VWRVNGITQRAHLVAVLLQRRLVLQVGAARRQAARLGVEVEGAVHAAVGRRDGVALQRQDERRQQLVDGGDLAERLDRGAGLQAGDATAKGGVRAAVALDARLLRC